MNKFQDHFQMHSKVTLGVKIKVEMYITVVWYDTKKLHPFKSECTSKEEAIGLIRAYKLTVMNEMFLANTALNFMSDFLNIDRKGKPIDELAAEIKTVIKKQMEEEEHEKFILIRS